MNMSKTNNVITSDIAERELHPASGMLMMILDIAGALSGVFLCIICPVLFRGFAEGLGIAAGLLLITLFSIMFAGLKVVNPNEALVLTLFGKYHGTIRKAGFFFVNPFCTAFNPTVEALQKETAQDPGETFKSGKTPKTAGKTRNRKVSTKTMTLNNAQQKVNDVDGNPVIIGSVVIWKVADPTKAVFNVENYFEYLSTQCDSIIRNSARMYPYDTMGDDDSEMTLRGSSMEIAEKMKAELQEKTRDAGIRIMEVRITHLAYAEEIAAAMLKRQQAAATIAAREQIVEGAVGMVHMALDRLEKDDLILLDDERKAAMVSNLLVVLCGDKEVQPVVNSGSLY